VASPDALRTRGEDLVARKRKSNVVWVDGIPITPITAKERKRLNEAIKKLHERLRKRYPELHGKVVDFVTHAVEEGRLYVGIRFEDKTEFSIRYSCGMSVVGVDLCDVRTGDYKTVREFMKPIST
jgi:hypothetical protein